MTQVLETTSSSSPRMRMNKRILTLAATGIGAAGIAFVVAGAIVFGDFGISPTFPQDLPLRPGRTGSGPTSSDTICSPEPYTA